MLHTNQTRGALKFQFHLSRAPIMNICSIHGDLDFLSPKCSRVFGLMSHLTDFSFHLLLKCWHSCVNLSLNLSYTSARTPPRTHRGPM